jgi:hypothetical protein
MEDRFILWECELFGKKEDIVSFLVSFKALSAKEKEDFIKSVIDKYGICSEQFYFVVQGFVFYVMLRHGLYWDEDVFQDAFLSILEKLRYWDERKGSLLSFVYSLVRDKVSQKRYREMVYLIRSMVFDDRWKYEEDGDNVEVSFESMDSDSLEGVLLLREISSQVLKGLREEVLGSMLRYEDSVYRRVVLWYMMQD